jgi:hypothetical protein
MLWLLSGTAALAASVALLLAFRAREGQVVKRPEWFETSLAILLTVGIGIGVMSFVAGVLQLVGFQ